MDNQNLESSSREETVRERDTNSSLLSRKILAGASRGLSRNTFFKSMLQLLQDAAGSNAIELRLIENGKLQCYELNPGKSRSFSMRLLQPISSFETDLEPAMQDGAESLCRLVIEGRIHKDSPYLTGDGSVSIGDTSTPIKIGRNEKRKDFPPEILIGGDFPSLAVIPFNFEHENSGLLVLKSRVRDFFSNSDIIYFEEIARILGIAIAHWNVQINLRERVKELTCLCRMAKISGQPDISLPEILQETAEMLPGAWRYPDIAAARIICDAIAYTTTGFRAGLQSLGADIVVNGKKRGSIEVAYTRKVREYDEGPFLKEERNLIDAVADEVAMIIRRRETEEEKEKLEEQLRHADRLATIGQLAAGVAHELNEPLANILGFAQLASRDNHIPDAVGKDLERIIAASLHARTVIERLNLFARQSPQKKGLVNLNRVINDGLYFLESRCSKAGIEMRRILNPELPEIDADQGQIYQVLVNLVVNAIQAMPEGGTLTIKTTGDDKQVGFSVEDTGNGMDDEVRKKIFVPFFTTKDINEGTGLGLAVVHGIVSAHGGTISVESVVGEGTLFDVRLPITEQDSA